MKNNVAQPLNYSAHAIEDLRDLEVSLRSTAPQSARVFRRLIEMLQHSVKFILPNCCDLIAPEDLRQAHLDLTRLPFPCVTFEAPWEKDGEVEQLGDFQFSRSTKRIALCWEASPEYELLPGLNDILKAFPEGGVFVLPIYWGPEYRQWTVALGCSFLPYENTLQELDLEQTLPASRIAHTATIEAGLSNSKAKHFKAEPFYLFPEFYEQTLSNYGGDIEKVYAQIILDSRDEVQAVVQACSVINCANVTTEEISAPAALNKKRMKKGQQPFFTYKILQLTDEQHVTHKRGSGGTHASPRMHLRRGHLRRLKSKVVWVRPVMVNTGSNNGVVHKDYAVQTKG